MSKAERIGTVIYTGTREEISRRVRIEWILYIREGGWGEKEE